MMESPIAKYQAATIRMTEAVAEAERVAKAIQMAATLLKDWKTTMLSNARLSFPAEIALQRRPSIDVNEWPDRQKLEQSLANYHTAKENLKAAWTAIPDNERSVVQPPEKFY